MEFQVKYYKIEEFTETIEEKTFINERALKSWYKKLWDEKKVKSSILSGWNRTLNKPIHYSIRSW